jgi:hypothetical protein
LALKLPLAPYRIDVPEFLVLCQGGQGGEQEANGEYGGLE